jgi:Domain of unknown function (DUF222)
VLEHMFDSADDAGVVDAITCAARAQNAMCARELAAIGELYARRAPADDAERFNWAVDGHENVVAEVAAALGISRGRASGRLRYAIALRERLPRVAEVFARGAIDFRLMAAVVHRTELVEDHELIAKLDAAVARHAPRWMRLSEPKLFERIDMWIARFDPAGLRVPGQRSENRYVEIGPTDSGLAGVWAQLHATDGAALERKLDAVADTVELGNGQQALDRAVHVRQAEQLSPERQARYLVDIARAHLLTRSGRDALLALVEAEHIAAEELAESPRVAELIDDIEALNRRTRLPGLRELRQRLYG